MTSHHSPFRGRRRIRLADQAAKLRDGHDHERFARVYSVVFLHQEEIFVIMLAWRRIGKGDVTIFPAESTGESKLRVRSG
jgi:hypothetical protein